MKKKFLKVTAFLLAVALTFAGAVYVLDFKYLDSVFKVDAFYEQEENTVDVLVLGSSHAYQGINTAVLWKEYGIASFNFCGAAQPIWNTYYYLEEALKTQTPKVIILDAYYVHMTEDYTDASTGIKNTYGLKWSDTKIEAIKATFDTESTGNQYFFSILQYHSRYSDLNKADFYPYQANKEMYENHKGFYCYFRSEKVNERDLTGVSYYNKMTEKIEYYYRKIFELAESKNIPVIAIAIPFNAEAYHQGFFNEAKYIAEKEYGARFYNFLTEYKDELNLNYTTDFADAQHLNYIGNTKLTRFLGDILRNEYNVPDRRNNEKYASWEADAVVYYNQLDNSNIKKITNIADYAEVFNNERYTVVMTSSFNDYSSIPANAKNTMIRFCESLSIPKSEYKKGGMWVFENGEKTYYNPCNADNYEKAVKIGSYAGIAVRKTLKFIDEEQTILTNAILANKTDATKAAYGINIVVFDNFTQSIIDTVGVDFTDNTFKR